MNTDYIYNPAPKMTLRDRAADFYWSNRHACDAGMFLGVVALFAAVLVQMA